jgi:hypothetical protein
VSKLVDPWARALLNEEVVAAALAAGRYDAALRFMEVALREAGDDERDAVRSNLAALVPKLPEADLLALLDRRKAGVDEDLDVPTLAARHLAKVAGDRHDMHLAQRLLGVAGPLLGDQGDAVAKLAQGGGTARVDARTVGLLLSSRDEESRRRGAEVAAGVANGLGLPGSPARLATRDDGGKPETIAQALEGLSADGAAIVIAGINVEQAAAAARFAEAQGTPVLLLRPAELGQPPTGRFTFLLGDDPSRDAKILQAAFVSRGTSAVWTVGQFDELGADAQATKSAPLACGDPPPLAAWKAKDIGIVLTGGLDCIDDVSVILEHAGLHPVVGLGLDGVGHKLPFPGFVLAAGQAPFDAHTSIASLKAWIANRQAGPSWWAALGHDAGLLAWEGVRSLPSSGTEDRREVATRRVAAAEALAHAAGDLWTSEAKGFDGARVLARQIHVRER